MSAFQDKCRQCGKEFKNYGSIAHRAFCSLACEAEWYRDAPAVVFLERFGAAGDKERPMSDGMESCANCGADVDKEPYVLCDECESGGATTGDELDALRADPRLQVPLDGPGSHRADLKELRAVCMERDAALDKAKDWQSLAQSRSAEIIRLTDALVAARAWARRWKRAAGTFYRAWRVGGMLHGVSNRRRNNE